MDIFTIKRLKKLFMKNRLKITFWITLWFSLLIPIALLAIIIYPLFGIGPNNWTDYCLNKVDNYEKS